MTDRIEELLSQMAAEDEDEERQEDVLALPSAEEAVPAAPRRDAGETRDGGTGDRSGGRTVEEIVSERPGPAAGEMEPESARAGGELWKDGPVWRAPGAQTEAVGTLGAAAERAARTGPEWTGRGGGSGPAEAGLERLYRQTVRGLRPAAPALPQEQVGNTARAQEPGSAASLAVDELDRAVRRDSRRYDGGMSIY